ncbi:MAG: MarR family transcriptional regulator [Candidatus Dormibacteria bacterium]|jgi:DNA-binding MarR family transcriptional regulator
MRGSPPSSADGGTAERALSALVQLLASVEAIEFRRWGDLGLTISQLRVLHLLRERPASCGQVAEHLGITASTATALIERIVRRGLVERGAHEGDRRVTDLHLSERGRLLLEETDRGKRGVITQSIGELSREDRERLATLLDRLAAGVQAREGGAASETTTAPTAATHALRGVGA